MTATARSGTDLNWLAYQGARFRSAVVQIGEVTILTRQAFVSLFTTRFEGRAFMRQMEELGVRSFGIGAATAIFVGVVMAIQFAFSLEKFGAMDSVGRIVALSEARELAPSLTSLVVGSRIAAGMAAEIGSMAVTEQIDAIRALGADPIKKLVVPRVLAGIIIMPLLCSFALVLGVGSAMLVCRLSFGISMPFFLSSALDAITVHDVTSGLGKTPFFGFLVAIIGCHFGFRTEGGTEGVGRSTTASVVVVSIAVLIADAFLTQVFLFL
ncbi:MAG: ABC transporter permease [Myxococcales bacterium]|nr:ABC transporter permease [Myxococcales bacterium]